MQIFLTKGKLYTCSSDQNHLADESQGVRSMTLHVAVLCTDNLSSLYPSHLINFIVRRGHISSHTWPYIVLFKVSMERYATFTPLQDTRKRW